MIGAHVKRLALLLAIATIFLGGASAQDILTADQFFAQVTERYAQINDYEGRIQIGTGKGLMAGAIAWKAPALLRIDFSQPSEQVIAFDGQTLVVYIPEFRAVLQQSTADSTAGGGATGANLATREGLKMMKRSYTIAWESSPSPIALDPGSSEQVMRLVLSRKTAAEGFTTIVLSIDPETKLIRRMEGTTLAKERISFDLTGIKVNQGIPEARFIYDSPASANVYNNFLFGSDN